MLPYVHGKVRSRKAYRPNAVTALSAALLSVFALFAAFRLLHAPQHHIAERQPYDAKDDDQLVQEANVLETDTLILRPKSPTSMLILLHRCGHSPLQWWHATIGCHDCFGLPEQVAITRAALRRGMGVVAVKASGKRGCWDMHRPVTSKDVPHIIQEVKRVESLMAWGGLPRFALGAAEGGAMALILARHLKLQGVCSVIMGVAPEQLTLDHTAESSKRWQFPPTLFVHMARDKTTAAWIKEDMKALQQQGVPAREIIVTEQQLSERFFSDRMPGFSPAASAAVFKALQAAGLIDVHGRLLKDPRPHYEMWKQAVQDLLEANNSLSHSDMLSIQQELNVAWAGHEITADPIEEVLDWFRKPSRSGHATWLTVNGVSVHRHATHKDAASLP